MGLIRSVGGEAWKEGSNSLEVWSREYMCPLCREGRTEEEQGGWHIKMSSEESKVR